MTYQSNMSVKDEPCSPASLDDDELTARHPSRGCTAMEQDVPAVLTARNGRSQNDWMQASCPEVKRKLQNVVIGRREAKGFPGVPRNLFEKPKSYQLTAAEMDKREKRKAQNRRAAKKCREKKKTQQHQIEEETAKVAKTNTDMVQLVRFFYWALSSLKTCLDQHLNCGDCKVSLSQQQSHKELICKVENILQLAAKTHIHENSVAENASHRTSLSDSSSSSTLSISDSMATGEAEPDNPMTLPSSNLNSWDLPSINPDIPDVNFDVRQVIADDVITSPLPEFPAYTPTQVPIKPLYMANDCPQNGLAAATELMSLQDGTTGDLHGSETMLVCARDCRTDTMPVSAGDCSTDSVFTDIECSADENMFPCVSPNLIQPYQASINCYPSTGLQASSLVPINGQDQNCNCRTGRGALCRLPADHNNNGGHWPDFVLAGPNDSSVVSPSNTEIYHQSQSHQRYFTFDIHQAVNEASDSEPISPFYTQGSSRRV